MSKTVKMFPVLNDALKEEAGINVCEPEFSYMQDEEEVKLILEDHEKEGNTYSALLRDPRCSWFPDDNKLIAGWKITISNPRCLFGKDGIAPADATLGVAVRWSSSGTEQQNTIPFGEFTDRNKMLIFEGEFEYPEGFLKNCLQLEFIVYLKKSGKIKTSETHLGNISGTVLGIVAVYQVYIDGNGSLFPILIEEDKKQPLWRIVHASFDVMSDLFSEDNIAIYLNCAHPDYHLIDRDSSDYNISFFSEVLSNALTLMTEVIIEQARAGGEWENILKGENYEEGSIAAAVSYFIRKLGWNPESILTLSESVHEYINRNLKGEL